MEDEYLGYPIKLCKARRGTNTQGNACCTAKEWRRDTLPGQETMPVAGNALCVYVLRAERHRCVGEWEESGRGRRGRRGEGWDVQGGGEGGGGRAGMEGW